MSLHKAIESGKEHRRPLKGRERLAALARRTHGECMVCERRGGYTKPGDASARRDARHLRGRCRAECLTQRDVDDEKRYLEGSPV